MYFQTLRSFCEAPILDIVRKYPIPNKKMNANGMVMKIDVNASIAISRIDRGYMEIAPPNMIFS
jgi:hypothetical protein